MSAALACSVGSLLARCADAASEPHHDCIPPPFFLVRLHGRRLFVLALFPLPSPPAALRIPRPLASPCRTPLFERHSRPNPHPPHTPSCLGYSKTSSSTTMTRSAVRSVSRSLISRIATSARVHVATKYAAFPPRAPARCFESPC